MNVELRRCVILLVAARTRKFRFTVVQRVIFQCAFAFKTLVTRFTLEISLLAVNKRMVFQVGLGGESFVAGGARVRLLSGVRPPVDFQVVLVAKALEANFALKKHVAGVLSGTFFRCILGFW